MAKILKLNAISPVADNVFPKNYEYSDTAENPEGIILRSFSMHEYPLGDNLKAVARAGAGVNNIPIDKCTEKGVVVFNTPGANANAVKELVVCEMFLGGRKIIDATNWVKTLKGNGDAVAKMVEKGKSSFVGQEVLGKTLGVIGLGAIGVMVANTAIDLGMNVLGLDPYISVDGAWHLNQKVKKVNDRDAIYKDCDYITIHVPLTPDTKEMFNKETFAKMKDGAVLINNSRGELVNTADVIEAVSTGKLARYITDFPNDDIIGVDNIITVPHLGASTPEAEDNCAYMAAQELVDYLENGNITNSVNFPSVSLERNSVARVTLFHKNIEGMISKITTAIANCGINIANFLDKSKKENAYLIIDLDSVPSDELIANLSAINGVYGVRVIK